MLGLPKVDTTKSPTAAAVDRWRWVRDIAARRQGRPSIQSTTTLQSALKASSVRGISLAVRLMPVVRKVPRCRCIPLTRNEGDACGRKQPAQRGCGSIRYVLRHTNVPVTVLATLLRCIAQVCQLLSALLHLLAVL